MAALRKSLWTIAAILVLPAPAAAQQTPDICGAVARIAAAARERPAFKSLLAAEAARQILVPGFAAGECHVTGEGVECREASHRGVFRNWPDLADCPGVAAFEPPPLPPPAVRIYAPENRSYRLGRFRIGRWVSCPGCAALGPSHFSMRIERRGRPEE